MPQTQPQVDLLSIDHINENADTIGPCPVDTPQDPAATKENCDHSSKDGTISYSDSERYYRQLSEALDSALNL